MNKLFTNSMVLVGLCVCLIIASCSKDNAIVEEVTPVEEPATQETTHAQYIDAQSTFLQLFATVITETVQEASGLSTGEEDCPLTAKTIDGDGNHVLLLDFNGGCTTPGGHYIKGNITVITTTPSLAQINAANPAIIQLLEDEIIMNGYKFKINKSAQSKEYDLKFYNGGSLVEPVFYFFFNQAIGLPEATIQMDSPSGKRTIITPPAQSSGFMRIIPGNLVSLDFTNLYNTEYQVKFLENTNNPNDPFWKINTYDPSGNHTDEFRVMSANDEDVKIQPSYPWPYDGTIQYWAKPTNNPYSVLMKDMDFSSDKDGCSYGWKDKYLKVCFVINPWDCTIDLCELWDLHH